MIPGLLGFVNTEGIMNVEKHSATAKEREKYQPESPLATSRAPALLHPLTPPCVGPARPSSTMWGPRESRGDQPSSCSHASQR